MRCAARGFPVHAGIENGGRRPSSCERRAMATAQPRSGGACDCARHFEQMAGVIGRARAGAAAPDRRSRVRALSETRATPSRPADSTSSGSAPAAPSAAWRHRRGARAPVRAAARCGAALRSSGRVGGQKDGRAEDAEGHRHASGAGFEHIDRVPRCPGAAPSSAARSRSGEAWTSGARIAASPAQASQHLRQAPTRRRPPKAASATGASPGARTRLRWPASAATGARRRAAISAVVAVESV